MVAKKRTAEKKSTGKKTSKATQVSPSKKTTKKGGAKETVARKRTTVMKPAKKEEAGKRKVSATKKAVRGKKTNPTPEQRYMMIQEEAYYVAERAKWAKDPTECWVEAERMVTERISS